MVQAAKQRAQLNAFAVLQPMRRLQNIGQHAMVLGAMLFQPGKSRPLHQLLFAPEVHAGKLQELIQQLTDLFLARAAHQRQAQRINCIHQDAMLIVHGAHAHVAGVTPREKSHMSLH